MDIQALKPASRHRNCRLYRLRDEKIEMSVLLPRVCRMTAFSISSIGLYNAKLRMFLSLYLYLFRQSVHGDPTPLKSYFLSLYKCTGPTAVML